MKRCVAVLFAVLFVVIAPSPVAAGGPAKSGIRVVTTGLADPYEITMGPDGWIWVTEKAGARVTRVDPGNGEKRVATLIPDAVHTAGSQDGVLGMALHPDLLKGRGQDYVYVAYTYDANPRPAEQDNRTKIVRYAYDRSGQRLHDPTQLITGMPSAVDHQSARLKFGPDGKLYYTIGDQGANQLTRYCTPNQAQRLPTAAEVRDRDWTAYQGKVLRLNPDGSIPGDNALLAGVRSHVHSYGHRNPQGLAFAPNGALYSSEQGPKTDDEINAIRRGGNYGWPNVAGYRDDKAYAYGDWSAAAGGCAALRYSDYEIPPQVPRTTESSFTDPAFSPPLTTFYTVPSDHDFLDPKCADGELYFSCWPTLAPSSLEAYSSRPGGAPVLLMPTLKDGTVYRLQLTAGGTKVGSVTPLGRSVNRYRDTTLSPDLGTIFVATDRAGLTRDADGVPTDALANPGAILALR